MLENCFLEDAVSLPLGGSNLMAEMMAAGCDEMAELYKGVDFPLFLGNTKLFANDALYKRMRSNLNSLDAFLRAGSSLSFCVPHS